MFFFINDRNSCAIIIIIDKKKMNLGIIEDINGLVSSEGMSVMELTEVFHKAVGDNLLRL